MSMDYSDLGNGIEFPWDNEFDPSLVSRRPSLTQRFSSVSDLSSVGSPRSSHRGSIVSLPTPPPKPEAYRTYSRDEVDVSHVQLSSSGSHGLGSPGGRSTQSPVTLPESLRAGTPPSASRSSFLPFTRTNVSYEPVSTTDKAKVSSSGAKRFSMKKKSSLLGKRHDSIAEEEFDMALLGSASPMGFTQQRTAYGPLIEDEREDAPMMSPTGTGVDLSSFVGPEVLERNRQEANGILTGGLGQGQGLKPELTIKSSDLGQFHANAPQTPLSPISPKAFRRISFRHPGLRRAPTLRDACQAEANKRGKVVEVIMEEESKDDTDTHHIDLDGLSGGNSAVNNDFDTLDGQSRRGTFTKTKTEVFYPQDNWKPFSMRWPYLSALILLSVGLSVVQEYLFRRGALYSFNTTNDLNTWEYFSFKYLPTLVAVSFGVLWQITDFEVKRLEAYYQLSKEGGALAAESINVDYITFFNFLRPVKALRYRHYAVAVSSIATLLAVSAVPTLQAASIDLRPNKDHPGQSGPGGKQIVFNSVFSRVLSTVLALIAIFGCILLYQLQRRPSGLVADVKGIAGIAAMANRSHILMDFKNMDTATPDMIHKQLKAHRYSLRNSSLAPEFNKPLSLEEKDRYDAKLRKHQNPHPLMLRLVAGIPFILGMVGFMVLMPVILFERRVNAIADKVPWLVTLFAVFIKLAWGTLETDVRMIEPFYILSKRHASPKALTLDYTSMAFGWMPIRAFLNGHVLVGLVGLGSVLAEVLTVCSASFGNVDGRGFVRGLPQAEKDDHNSVNAGEETYVSFWVSFMLALSILTFLCLVAIFVYSRRRHPFLPRQPNTIASVLAFIHQSKMLYDFVGTEKKSNDEMVKHLVGIKKTYGLGWFAGRDGEMHCGVDEEELVSSYKHGEDASKASMPWLTNWTDY